MTRTGTVPLASSFTEAFAGTVITPADERYDAARAVWNGAVEAPPALIAQCHTTGDIVAAVNLVRAAGCRFAVRAGGHSVAGLSTCDDGVVIDLSQMRDVTVNAQTRTATVGPGATWADFDAATGAHGLASTGGLISTTGVAGLTLGGGIGWLQRKYGLSCDNLVAAEVATADGELVRVSDTEHAELLWGLRGGGGNFGIVTSFVFALHPVSTVLGGLMLFPLERGRQVLAAFREWAAEAPDEASMLAAILTAPPEPFVPQELTGAKAVAILGCWCGDLDAGAAALAPLRQLGPAADVFGPMPYSALQGMLDGGAPYGVRNYFRGGYIGRSQRRTHRNRARPRRGVCPRRCHRSTSIRWAARSGGSRRRLPRSAAVTLAIPTTWCRRGPTPARTRSTSRPTGSWPRPCGRSRRAVAT